MSNEAKVASRVQRKMINLFNQLITEMGIRRKERLLKSIEEKQRRQAGDNALLQQDVLKHPDHYHVLYLQHGDPDKLKQIFEKNDISYLEIEPSVLEHNAGGFIISDTDYIILKQQKNVHIEHLYTKEQLEAEGLDENGQTEEERQEAREKQKEKEAKDNKGKKNKEPSQPADKKEPAKEEPDVQPKPEQKAGKAKPVRKQIFTQTVEPKKETGLITVKTTKNNYVIDPQNKLIDIGGKGNWVAYSRISNLETGKSFSATLESHGRSLGFESLGKIQRIDRSNKQFDTLEINTADHQYIVDQNLKVFKTEDGPWQPYQKLTLDENFVVTDEPGEAVHPQPVTFDLPNGKQIGDGPLVSVKTVSDKTHEFTFETKSGSKYTIDTTYNTVKKNNEEPQQLISYSRDEEGLHLKTAGQPGQIIHTTPVVDTKGKTYDLAIDESILPKNTAKLQVITTQNSKYMVDPQLMMCAKLDKDTNQPVEAWQSYDFISEPEPGFSVKIDYKNGKSIITSPVENAKEVEDNHTFDFKTSQGTYHIDPAQNTIEFANNKKSIGPEPIKDLYIDEYNCLKIDCQREIPDIHLLYSEPILETNVVNFDEGVLFAEPEIIQDDQELVQGGLEEEIEEFPEEGDEAELQDLDKETEDKGLEPGEEEIGDELDEDAEPDQSEEIKETDEETKESDELERDLEDEDAKIEEPEEGEIDENAGQLEEGEKEITDKEAGIEESKEPEEPELSEEEKGLEESDELERDLENEDSEIEEPEEGEELEEPETEESLEEQEEDGFEHQEEFEEEPEEAEELKEPETEETLEEQEEDGLEHQDEFEEESEEPDQLEKAEEPDELEHQEDFEEEQTEPETLDEVESQEEPVEESDHIEESGEEPALDEENNALEEAPEAEPEQETVQEEPAEDIAEIEPSTDESAIEESPEFGDQDLAADESAPEDSYIEQEPQKEASEISDQGDTGEAQTSEAPQEQESVLQDDSANKAVTETDNEPAESQDGLSEANINEPSVEPEKETAEPATSDEQSEINEQPSDESQIAEETEQPVSEKEETVEPDTQSQQPAETEDNIPEKEDSPQDSLQDNVIESQESVKQPQPEPSKEEEKFEEPIREETSSEPEIVDETPASEPPVAEYSEPENTDKQSVDDQSSDSRFDADKTEEPAPESSKPDVSETIPPMEETVSSGGGANIETPETSYNQDANKQEPVDFSQDEISPGGTQYNESFENVNFKEPEPPVYNQPDNSYNQQDNIPHEDNSYNQQDNTPPAGYNIDANSTTDSMSYSQNFAGDTGDIYVQDDVLLDSKSGRSQESLNNAIYDATVGTGVEETHGKGREYAGQFLNNIAGGQSGISGLLGIQEQIQKSFDSQEMNTLSVLMQEQGKQLGHTFNGLDFSNVHNMEKSCTDLEKFLQTNKLVESHNYAGVRGQIAVDHVQEYGRNQFGLDGLRGLSGNYVVSHTETHQIQRTKQEQVKQTQSVALKNSTRQTETAGAKLKGSDRQAEANMPHLKSTAKQSDAEHAGIKKPVGAQGPVGTQSATVQKATEKIKGGATKTDIQTLRTTTLRNLKNDRLKSTGIAAGSAAGAVGAGAAAGLKSTSTQGVKLKTAGAQLKTDNSRVVMLKKIKEKEQSLRAAQADINAKTGSISKEATLKTGQPGLADAKNTKLGIDSKSLRGAPPKVVKTANFSNSNKLASKHHANVVKNIRNASKDTQGAMAVAVAAKNGSVVANTSLVTRAPKLVAQTKQPKVITRTVKTHKYATNYQYAEKNMLKLAHQYNAANGLKKGDKNYISDDDVRKVFYKLTDKDGAVSQDLARRLDIYKNGQETKKGQNKKFVSLNWKNNAQLQKALSESEAYQGLQKPKVIYSKAKQLNRMKNTGLKILYERRNLRAARKQEELTKEIRKTKKYMQNAPSAKAKAKYQQRLQDLQKKAKRQKNIKKISGEKMNKYQGKLTRPSLGTRIKTSLRNKLRGSLKKNKFGRGVLRVVDLKEKIRIAIVNRFRNSLLGKLSSGLNAITRKIIEFIMRKFIGPILGFMGAVLTTIIKITLEMFMFAAIVDLIAGFLIGNDDLMDDPRWEDIQESMMKEVYTQLVTNEANWVHHIKYELFTLNEPYWIDELSGHYTVFNSDGTIDWDHYRMSAEEYITEIIETEYVEEDLGFGQNEAVATVVDTAGNIISAGLNFVADTLDSFAITPAPTSASVQAAINQDLGVFTPMTESELNSYIASIAPSNSPFQGQAAVFIEASNQSGLDPRYVFAHASLESDYGRSNQARTKNNFFGIGAFDSNPSAAYTFNGSYDTGLANGIVEGSKWISNHYYNSSYSQRSLSQMRFNDGVHQYATDLQWANKIGNILRRIPNSSATAAPPNGSNGTNGNASLGNTARNGVNQVIGAASTLLRTGARVVENVAEALADPQGIARGPEPFPDAPVGSNIPSDPGAYKWIRLLDGGVEVRFAGIAGDSYVGIVSNVKEIMTMGSVAQIESQKVVDDADLGEIEVAEDSPAWQRIAAGLKRFWSIVENFFRSITGALARGFNNLFRTIPAYDEWWTRQQARLRTRMYMLYCAPLFEYSHTEEYSLQLGLHPTLKTIEGWEEAHPEEAFEGEYDYGYGHEGGGIGWGYMCSGFGDVCAEPNRQRENDYLPNNGEDYEGDYMGYGCKMWDGFAYKFDSEEDMYYNNVLCPQVKAASRIEDFGHETDICVAPGSNGHRWLEVTDTYGHSDCWHPLNRDGQSVEYEVQASAVYGQGVAFIDEIAGDNYGYASIFSNDDGETYTVGVMKNQRSITYTDGDGDEMDPVVVYDIYYYSFGHDCQADHNGVYCGGHFKVIVTGCVFHMTNAQKMHNEDTFEEKFVDEERLHELAEEIPDLDPDNEDYYTEDGYLWETFHVLYYNRDGDGHEKGDPFLVQYADFNEEDPSDEAMDACRDLFDIDASYTHAYGRVDIHFDEERHNFRGWDYDMINAATGKLEDDWLDLYNIGATQTQGGDYVTNGRGVAIALESTEINGMMAELDAAYGDNPDWPARRQAILTALTYVGKVGYSQNAHGTALAEGSSNDCSGYVSQCWSEVLQRNYTTSSFYSSFNTRSWDDNIQPGDIILHYQGAIGDGADDHALIYIGKDSQGRDISVDCTGSGTHLRSRGDTYYHGARYINMSEVAGYE